MDDKEIKEIFVKRLRHYIELSGKQQKEIAKDLGIPVATFNNWCTGRIMPRIGGVDMLAKYFDVPRSDLLLENGSDVDTQISFLIEKLTPSNKEHLLVYLKYLLSAENKNED